MKLVFLGDSLTWGGYGGNFVAEVAGRCPQHEIINAGVGGDTVLNLLARLGDVLADHEPDGVFVMIGGNDAISLTQPQTRVYYRQVKKVPEGIVTAETFSRSYRELLERLQLALVQVWVGLPPLEYNPETVETMRQYNTLAAEAARPLNIPVIDLMTKLAPNQVPDRPEINMNFINLIGQRSASGWDDFAAEKQKGSFTFTFDGLHLMPEVASQIAEWLITFMEL